MMKKRDNKGFSIIEIIVTLAIMAIITASAVSIYSWISKNKIRSMAGNVNSAISDVRSKTLSKSGNWQLIIKKDSTGKYVAIINQTDNAGNVSSENKTIADYGKISVMTLHAGVYTLDEQFELHISFKKADGSVDEMAVYRSGTRIDEIKGEIKLEYSNLSRTVKLIKNTGKHYTE